MAKGSHPGTWKEMGPDQPRNCDICDLPVKISDRYRSHDFRGFPVGWSRHLDCVEFTRREKQAA